MWDTDWASEPPSLTQTAAPGEFTSHVDADSIESIYLLHWQEHCLECAVPDCYQVCSLYVPRADRKCARLRYGIYPNAAYQGPYGFGADVSFRRWGKLESRLWFGTSTLTRLRRLASVDRTVYRGFIRPASTAMARLNPKRKLSRAYYLIRDRALRWATRDARDATAHVDCFLMEAWNPGDQPFNLVVEYFANEAADTRGDLRFRQSFPMEPGRNLHRVPIANMNLDFQDTAGRLLVYPEADAEVRVIFTWLDLISMARTSQAPAAKVKCVVWDLDNTMWDGILVEDGPDKVQPRSESLELVQQLDQRGIVQSIASKNDHELAWNVLSELGISEYFLHPAINWGQKSHNIKQIATALNIGVDTFAFIDDSTFERGEVANQLPEVRCFDVVDVPRLLAFPEFDVPVTAASRQRRQSYIAESQRDAIKETFGADYDSYLRSCQLTARVFTPSTPAEIDRALELLQRSNQLNLSTHRYERDELLACLADPDRLCLATHCHDRYGDYGIVGFATIQLAETPRLVDFVLSCRVAQKKVEHAWFARATDYFRQQGCHALEATFIGTDRNGLLRRVLGEVGFEELAGEDPQTTRLRLSCDEPSAEQVVAVTWM